MAMTDNYNTQQRANAFLEAVWLDGIGLILIDEL